MGERAGGNVEKELAKRLGKDLRNCTDKSFRRLEATRLTETGTSAADSQIAVNWKGTTVLLEHM